MRPGRRPIDWPAAAGSPVSIHPAVASTIRSLDAIVIGPGIFHQPAADLPRRRLPRRARALGAHHHIANLAKDAA
jgi:hypothetical protein